MAKALIICTLVFSSLTQFSNKRMLLIYADKATNVKLIEQQKLFKDQAANLKERDIEVKVLLQDQAPKIFKDKRINGSFTVILIGKDKGEKLRTTEVLSPEKLYATVDAMPMRKDEMKH